MSEIDRATKVALDAYPPSEFEGRLGEAIRAACRVGYRRALTDAAEWMAKQGVTKEVTIGMATEEIDCSISRNALDSLGAGPGDKVRIQITKVE